MSEQQENKTGLPLFNLFRETFLQPLESDTMKKVLTPWKGVFETSVEQVTEVQKQMLAQWQENMGTMNSLTQESTKQMEVMMRQGQEIFQGQWEKLRK